jgi:hypothetical protein
MERRKTVESEIEDFRYYLAPNFPPRLERDGRSLEYGSCEARTLALFDLPFAQPAHYRCPWC